MRVPLKHPKPSVAGHVCHVHTPRVLSSAVVLGLVSGSIVCLVAYSKICSKPILAMYTDIPTEHNMVQRVSMLSSVSQRKPPISCYIITLNTSLRAVALSPQLTCYPYLGSRITDAMFALVSARVQSNLLANTSSWGAYFINNQSVSIAYNHILLWRRLAALAEHSDMMIFEDDIVVDRQALLLYNKIRGSGVLSTNNYILKLTNQHRMQWLGGSELRFIHQFWLGDNSFGLHKCVCRTRQNFFSSAAYVIDRHAARVLLQHHLPLEWHVDVFMHYIGCQFCNFFLVDKDALQFTGRVSTHKTPSDGAYRMVAAFKEQVNNMLMTSCY